MEWEAPVVSYETRAMTNIVARFRYSTRPEKTTNAASEETADDKDTSPSTRQRVNRQNSERIDKTADESMRRRATMVENKAENEGGEK